MESFGKGETFSEKNENQELTEPDEKFRQDSLVPSPTEDIKSQQFLFRIDIHNFQVVTIALPPSHLHFVFSKLHNRTLFINFSGGTQRNFLRAFRGKENNHNLRSTFLQDEGILPRIQSSSDGLRQIEADRRKVPGTLLQALRNEISLRHFGFKCCRGNSGGFL